MIADRFQNASIDPRLAIIVRLLDDLRRQLGLHTDLESLCSILERHQLAEVAFEEVQDVNGVDVVHLRVYADQLSSKRFIETLELRSYPLASLRVTVKDDDLDADEYEALTDDVREQFQSVALETVLDGATIRGASDDVASPATYGRILLRRLLDEVGVAVERQALTVERRFDPKHLDAEREQVRREVDAVSSDITQTIRQLLHGSRSQAQLLADLEAVDRNRRRRLSEAASRVNASEARYDSLLQNVETWDLRYELDAQGKSSTVMAFVSLAVGVVLQNAWSALPALRGIIGRAMSGKKLSPAAVDIVWDQINIVVQADRERTYREIDRALLGVIGQDPLWRLTRIVREAKAIREGLSAHA